MACCRRITCKPYDHKPVFMPVAPQPYLHDYVSSPFFHGVICWRAYADTQSVRTVDWSTLYSSVSQSANPLNRLVPSCVRCIRMLSYLQCWHGKMMMQLSTQDVRMFCNPGRCVCVFKKKGRLNSCHCCCGVWVMHRRRADTIFHCFFGGGVLETDTVAWSWFWGFMLCISQLKMFSISLMSECYDLLCHA